MFVDNSDVGKFVLYFSFLDYTFFFVKRTSSSLISDQICFQNCEKILKAKITNSEDDLRSLGNTVYQSFFPVQVRAEQTKPQNGRFGSE